MTMDQRVKPNARLQPLPPEHSPELREHFDSMKKNLGFVPNSILIMQRKPKMAKAFAQMTASIWAPDSEVDRGLKRLLAHVASRAAGCQYCMAHTASGALHFGVDEAKVAAIWDYQTSPLFSAAERAALAYADAMVTQTSVPDDVFAELKRHYDERAIVEISVLVGTYLMHNRVMKALAIDLEADEQRGR
jgi:uncharacterized peroxidase-related enzyme